MTRVSAADMNRKCVRLLTSLRLRSQRIEPLGSFLLNKGSAFVPLQADPRGDEFQEDSQTCLEVINPQVK